MEEQGAIVTIINLPTLSPIELSVFPRFSDRPATITNHVSARETSLITTPSASFEPVILFQTAQDCGANAVASKNSQHPTSVGKVLPQEVQKYGPTAELAGNRSPSTSYKSKVLNQKASQQCPAHRSTEVRLVSPGSSSKTETILQIDAPDESGTDRLPSDGRDEKLKTVKHLKQVKAPTSKPKYSKLQWLAIFSSWFLAMNGLVLFLSFLGFGLTGYYTIHMAKYGSIFISVNGIVSAAASVYFCVKLYSFFS